MRDLVDQMLAMLDRRSWSIAGTGDEVGVTTAGTRIDVGAGASDTGSAFERLAEAIEAAIAFQRARRMVEAAGMTSQLVPLWLVSGSDVLAQWLRWAGTGNALRKVLHVTEVIGLSPVTGHLDRRARRELGQGGARIRVRGGMAVAERIELSDRPRCIATIGERALIRIEDHRLPDTLIVGLQNRDGHNTRHALADVVSHPFVAAADLTIAEVVRSGSALVFEVDDRWASLEPVPDAARSVLPPDHHPVFPWCATADERHRLDGLVAEARHRLAARRDRR